MTESPREVPIKTILATIGLVVATYLLWLVLRQVAYILKLVVVAALFAVALNPAVDFLMRRAHMRRALASTVVFVAGATLFFTLVYLFAKPLVDQAQQFTDRFPEMVDQARNGKGAIGEVVQHYHIDRWVEENRDKIQNAITTSSGPAATIVKGAISVVVSVLTVLVLTFLMLLQGPEMWRSFISFFDEAKQGRIRSVSEDCSRAVTGYVTGNLLISAIAGAVTFITMLVMGVPFAFVLAVWVAFTDLIPLIGATLGAVPTILFAFLHSTRAGIVALIVYILYQQIENHILQPSIMAKTVKMSALVVLVSVLIGVKLAGFVGALFAIPIASVLQVIIRNLLENRGVRHQPPEQVSSSAH